MRRAAKVDANPAGPFDVTVFGEPAPQGSKAFKGMRGGKAILIEQVKRVKPWRIGVEWACAEAIGDRQTPLFDCPVEAWIYFYFYKPKSSSVRRLYPNTRPDIDKLLRSTFDALANAGVLREDSRVVKVHASKLFCGCDDSAMSVPGARIRLEAL